MKDENGRWVPDPRAIERFMSDGPAPSDEMPGGTGRPRRDRRRRRDLRSRIAQLATTIRRALRPAPLPTSYRPAAAGYTPRHRRTH